VLEMRHMLRMLSDLTGVMLAIGVTLVIVGVTILVLGLTVLAIFGVPMLGLVTLARINTTTVEWPHAEVVAMRARLEQQFPPPPASSFDGASITTYYDGDKWKCVRYKSEASPADTRTFYEETFRAMQWAVSDGYGLDGPYTWQLSVIAMNGTVRLTPWDQGSAARSASPAHRVAVCFTYESWLWPKRAQTTTIASWPDPTVAAWREKVERAYPPDPSWSFSSATMIRRPSGDTSACITYQTGTSEPDARAYYRRWQGNGTLWRGPGEPYLGKSSISATEGAITVCLF
jgi:hypothetical protein